MPGRSDHRPFRTREAAEHGVTRGRLAGPGYRSVFRGVHVDADAPDSVALRADAAALVCDPRMAFCGRTAALLRGLPVDDDGIVYVTLPADAPRPRGRPGLEPRSGLVAEDVAGYAGRRLTGPETTFLQLAEELDLVELVVVGDAMLRGGWTTPAALDAAVTGARRRRGVVRARQAVPLLRERVDSPMETRTRLVLVFAGLPCPETGWDVHAEEGGWLGRPDLAYPQLRLAIQYEGDVHRSNPRRWRADVLRDEVLEDHGWSVLKVVADDVLVHPGRLVERVLARMERQRLRLGLA